MTEQFFNDLQKSGISFIDHFIDEPVIRKLVNWSDKILSEGEFKEAKISGDKLLNQEIRGDLTYWPDPISPSVEWIDIKKILDKLQLELNQRYFLGIKQYECHLAYYPVGTFYKKHIDRLKSDSSRIFTFIIYLNDNWKEGDGGELVIYDKKGNEIQRILPLGGRFVGFMSDEFPHEVLPAKRARMSFTGWMHNKILY